MNDWIKLIALVLAMIFGAVYVVVEMRECKARGGVLVNYSCVKEI